MGWCPLERQAGLRPEAQALIGSGRAYSYAEWDAGAARAAGQLHQAGVRAGDRVAVWLEPGLPYLTLLAGLWRVGAVAFPVSTRFPVKALWEAVAGVQARAIVLGQVTGFPLLADNIAAMAVSRLVSGAAAPPAPRLGDDPARPATLVLTSGSQGGPKAVAHTLAAHRHAARRANANMPLGPGDRWMLSLPLYHVAGLGVVFRCLEAGAAIVLPEPGEALAETMAAGRATHVSLVATQLHRLLCDGAGRAALRACKAVLLGGSAVPEPLVREAHGLGVPLYASYGMTETAAQICATAPGDPPERLASAGRALEAGTVRVTDAGVIAVRGGSLFLGYAEGAGIAPAPLDGAGWFHTGDLGCIDAAGYLHVTGRRDNMFIVGGENVQPEAIEAALLRLPGVQRALVSPLPDAEFGAVPVAFVRRYDGAAPDAAALCAALAAALPRHRLPRAVWPWPDDICGPDDKPRRRDFAALARARLTCPDGCV